MGRLTATDTNMGKNAHVRYSMGLLPPGVPAAVSFMSVDVESGTMRALCPLDYEDVRAFEVEVWAVDTGSLPLSTRAVLHVVVRDKNDNAPVVLHLPPDSSMAEGELVLCWVWAGYLVAKVVDADMGQNVWLLHKLVKEMDLGLFHVGLHSGKVRMAWAVAENDTPRQRPVVLVRDRGQLLCSATATLSIALVDGFSNNFLQLSDAAVERQEPQAAEEDMLTTYLISSLDYFWLFFVLSVLAFSVHKLCKTCLWACLVTPSASCYADGDFATGHMDVAKTETLPLAYCYEVCLSRGSDKSALQFLKHELHSQQRRAEARAGKDEERLCSSQPAGEREGKPGSTAPRPAQAPDRAAGGRAHA